MAQRMMFDQIEHVYRGQATDGTVITVKEDGMDLALRKAGKAVFETDWWSESQTAILEHWGLYGKRWIDDATKMPRLTFVVGEPKKGIVMPQNPTGPLSSRLQSKSQSGPLSARIQSGPLGTKRLSEDTPDETKP